MPISAWRDLGAFGRLMLWTFKNPARVRNVSPISSWNIWTIPKPGVRSKPIISAPKEMKQITTPNIKRIILRLDSNRVTTWRFFEIKIITGVRNFKNGL